MANEPESLEETQARLAKLQQPAEVTSTQPAPPSPSASPWTAAPSPYGPAPDGPRPDPYAAGAAGVQPTLAQTMPTPQRQSGVIISLIVVGILLVVGISTAVALFQDNVEYGPVDDPYSDPRYDEYPGVSWLEPDEVLDQPAYEAVVASGEILMEQLRADLTSRYGVEWVALYEPYSGLEANGYGGDSMLNYWDSGMWQGSVMLDDPGARQGVIDALNTISIGFAGEGLLLRNTIYEDDEIASTSQFGAPELEDQALWSAFESFPQFADLMLSVEVFDTNIPVDESFTGDYAFQAEDRDGRLFISLNAYASALLKVQDRQAFIDAIEAFEAAG